MEDRVDGFRRVQRILSRISLGLSGLFISSSPLIGLSLNPSLSLDVFQTKRERKNKKEWLDRKKKRGKEVYGETEKEGKRRRRKE
jgi:hypothetical protein